MMSSSPGGVMAALRAMAERPDSSALLPKLNVPALVIAGAEDPITPPADAERMASRLPNARAVIVPHAAHLANVEQADTVNRAIEEFLAAQRG
jgi:3-oxoadipate enol-lactonase